MSVQVSFDAIYEPVDDGWVQARIQELRAVITAGASLDEAKDLLLDALREYLLSLGEGEQAAVNGHPGSRERLDIVLGA